MKQLNKITAVRVWSSNMDGILMTFEAYNELRLTMSSGDFGAHKAKVEQVEDFSGVVTLMDLSDPFFNPTEYIQQSETSYINNVIKVDFVRKIRLS